MIDIEMEMTYRVRTGNPLGPTSGSPRAVLQYWQVTDAELSGPRIKATLASTGMDWMQVSDDGFWRPDVRAQFLTDDGAVILMSYIGLVEQTAAFKRAAETNAATDWNDQYMRLSLIFNTGEPAIRLDESEPVHRRRQAARHRQHRVFGFPSNLASQGRQSDSVPTIRPQADDRRRAPRNCAFAHPTAFSTKKRGAWRRV